MVEILIFFGSDDQMISIAKKAVFWKKNRLKIKRFAKIVYFSKKVITSFYLHGGMYYKGAHFIPEFSISVRKSPKSIFHPSKIMKKT